MLDRKLAIGIEATQAAGGLDRVQTICSDRSLRLTVDHEQVAALEVVLIEFQTRRIGVRFLAGQLDAKDLIPQTQGGLDLGAGLRHLDDISGVFNDRTFPRDNSLPKRFVSNHPVGSFPDCRQALLTNSYPCLN